MPAEKQIQASDENIQVVRNSFLSLYPPRSGASSFNRENFLVLDSETTITNKQLFEVLERAILQEAVDDGQENRQMAVAQGVSSVLHNAGFTGMYVEDDQTMVVFKPEDLPNLTLHAISPMGAPEGTSEELKLGDVVVKSPDKPPSSGMKHTISGVDL